MPVAAAVRDLEAAGQLGRADLLAAQVLEGDELGLAEPGPPGHDVGDPAAGRDEVAQREQGGRLLPLLSALDPRRGRGRLLLVGHDRPSGVAAPGVRLATVAILPLT